MLSMTLSGAGRPVVLLHGLPCPPGHMAPLAAALAGAGHRAVVVDLPGYGASPALPGEYSMARATCVLEDALRARGLDDVDVVGFSGGAYRALALAVSGRVRVGRVVLLAGMSGLDPALAGPYLQMADAIEAGADLGPMLAERLLSPAFAAERPDAARDVAGWLRAAPASVVAAEMRAMTRAEDLRPRLGTLDVPLTARVGELDAATPPAWSEEIVARAPFGMLQVVPARGHALLLEDAEATLAAVRTALAPGGAALPDADFLDGEIAAVG